jgi:acyl carrier protein
MDYQNLLAALSREHAVPIPEADVQGLQTIDDLVRYLAARRPASR